MFKNGQASENEKLTYKGGDYVNDACIVYTDKPYVISIYTKGISNDNEVIAHISKMIYNYQNEK